MASRPAASAARRPTVTAVLVAHDGARWLPDVVAALGAQTRAPDRLVAVDTGSRDASAKLLTAAFGGTRVRWAPRGTGFGAAVALGLESCPPLRSGEPAGDGPVEWIWLLHDDCVPEPAALERLLALVEHSPSVAVVGPKARDLADPRVLLEVGLTTDRAGNLGTGVDGREVDQGQHDDVTDVLAVGSAGALVRRDVWDALGGFDRRLPMFRDDLDFGWRVWLAGHRVAVATDAVVRHAAAASRGARRVDATRGRRARVERRHAAYVLLANASPAGAVLRLGMLAVDTALRALALVLTRRPVAAADEIAAYAGVLTRLPWILAGRRDRARRGTRTVARRELRHLFPSRGARLRLAAAHVLDHLGRRELAAARDRALRDGVAPVPRWRLVVTAPGVLLVVALGAVAAVAEHRLLGSGVLVGGRLLPPPGGASDLWHGYTSTWHDVGLGSTTPAPPYLAVVALVATVLLGKAWLAIDVLLLAAVPLAGLSAYAALRRLVPGRAVRAWGAATYALLPVATGAVAGGRLGTAMALVAVPPALSAAGCGLADARAGRGLRRCWLATPWLAVALAGAPPLYPIALLALAGVAAVALLSAAVRRTRPIAAARQLVGAVVVAGVPLLLLAPWPAHVWADRSPLTLGVGWPVAALRAPTALDLLLAHPGGPAAPPLWTLAPVVAAALAVTARRDRPGGRWAWWVVACAVAVGVVDARTTATAAVTGRAATGWPGAATIVVGAGLVAAAVLAASGARERLATRSFGWRQLTAGLLAVAAVAAPLGAAAAWAVRRPATPVARVADRAVLPPFVAEDVSSGPAARALVLRGERDGTVGYALAGRSAITAATADLAEPPTARRALAATVAALLGTPGEAAASLATMGVRYVVVTGVRPAASAAATALDGQPGLVRSTAAGHPVWRVVPPTGGIVTLAPAAAAAATSGRPPTAATLDGAVSGAARLPRAAATLHVPPGPPGRLLVLATPADQVWVATVGDRRLARRVAWGWAQAFALPDRGGAVRLVATTGARGNWLAGALAAFAVVLVLAAPSVGAAARPPARSRQLADPPADKDADAAVALPAARGREPAGSSRGSAR